MGTPEQGDDHVSSYSASASTGSGRAPDFVAPSSHLQGLRDPGSWLDANHPEGILSARYFRGSGTSESAAITSGAVALLLDKNPALTPDQVKRYFADKAVKLTGANGQTQGAGEINPGAMTEQPSSYPAQSFPSSTGTGSLELSRGQDHLTRDGIVLAGERDIFGMPFDSAAMAAAEASATSWSGGNWNGSSWSGSSWSSSSWSGSSWSSSSWSGSSWSGSSWSSSSWSSSSWSGSSWSSSSWSGSSWSGSSWSGRSWADASWS
jgi:serine protease AprX